jgi:2,4-dienoyl-CoA reductase-like NADH-dependent reductase (Old Yellow Enzyme family)
VSVAYEGLLSPLEIGRMRLRNRILFSAHQTTLVEDGLPTEDFLAYHEARARGGAGLIVLEANMVHPSSVFSGHAIDLSRDDIVPIYERLGRALHRHGAAVFVQMGHTGREAYLSDHRPPPVAPASTPTERFHIVPRRLRAAEIEALVDSFAAAARRVERAGLDGVELLGSHGYLLAEFWSPLVNRRHDRYGGDDEGRLRFVREVLAAVRQAVGPDFVVGMRMSVGEQHPDGLTVPETLEIMRRIEATGVLDYWSVVTGSSSTYASSSGWRER